MQEVKEARQSEGMMGESAQHPPESAAPRRWETGRHVNTVESQLLPSNARVAALCISNTRAAVVANVLGADLLPVCKKENVEE